MQETGWVYVLTNKAMPGLVKVGYTNRHPTERAHELDNTGVPHPFVAEFGARVENPKAVEKTIHAYLENAGFSEAKEFFRCEASEAIAAILTINKNVYEQFFPALEKEQEEQRRRERIAEELENIKQQEKVERIQRTREMEFRNCIRVIENRNSFEKWKIDKIALPKSLGEPGDYSALAFFLAIVISLSLGIGVESLVGPLSTTASILIWYVLFCLSIWWCYSQLDQLATKRHNIKKEKKRAELLAPLDRLFPTSKILKSTYKLPFESNGYPPFFTPLPQKKLGNIELTSIDKGSNPDLTHGARRIEYEVKNENSDWVIVLLILQQNSPYWHTVGYYQKRLHICYNQVTKVRFPGASPRKTKFSKFGLIFVGTHIAQR